MYIVITKLVEVFAGKKIYSPIPISLITYLSVFRRIDLGGELEAREGVAGGQLVVEGQQAVGLQSNGTCRREVVHVWIESTIVADCGT